MRLIQNAQTASDLPGSFIIMGVVAVIVFQVAVNVGMVVGFMPVTGIPLPLMSYGGSSILFTFLALGIVMNVRMRRFVNEDGAKALGRMRLAVYGGSGCMEYSAASAMPAEKRGTRSTIFLQK